MAEAVDLSKLHGTDQVEHALKVCADAGRFSDGDLPAILAHEQIGTVIPFPAKASEESSLQRATRSWEGFGRRAAIDQGRRQSRARRARGCSTEPGCCWCVCGCSTAQAPSTITGSPAALPDAYTDLRPEQARGLALELLQAAEDAERQTLRANWWKQQAAR